MAQWPGFTKTRFAPLGLTQQAPGLWRFVDYSERPDMPRVVGPQYKTKMEALADLYRYAHDCWGA